MSTESGWEGILDDDEKILWQGQPDHSFVLEPKSLIGAVFGLFFAGFAVFWMAMATMAPGPFWLFGLPFFFIGASIVLSSIFGSTYRRRHSFYSLSNRRAFIATQIPFVGRQLKHYLITPDTEIEMIETPNGRYTTINFAKSSKTRYHRSSNSGRIRGSTTTLTPIGFERIPDGRRVYGMMRDIQKGDV